MSDEFAAVQARQPFEVETARIYKGLTLALALALDASKREEAAAEQEVNSQGSETFPSLRQTMIFDKIIAEYVASRANAAWESKFLEVAGRVIPSMDRLARQKSLQKIIPGLAEAWKQYEEGLVTLREHANWVHVKLGEHMMPILQAEYETLKRERQSAN